MAAAACLARVEPAPICSPDTFDEGDARLRIVDHIEPGFGVVPIVGDNAGSHLLQEGEVAIYDERWRDAVCLTGFEMSAGLYCYEHQQPRSDSPLPDTRRDVTRKVVSVFRHPRQPQHWAYRELRSRVHRGVRVPARIEGPIYEWGLLDALLGPIVGIYRPIIRSAH